MVHFQQNHLHIVTINVAICNQITNNIVNINCQPAQPGRLLRRHFWSYVRPWDGLSTHLYWYRQRSRRLAYSQVIIRTCRPFTLLDHPDHFERCTAKIQYKYHDEINAIFKWNAMLPGLESTPPTVWQPGCPRPQIEPGASGWPRWSSRLLALIDNEMCPIAKTNIQRKLWWLKWWWWWRCWLCDDHIAIEYNGKLIDLLNRFRVGAGTWLVSNADNTWLELLALYRY